MVRFNQGNNQPYSRNPHTGDFVLALDTGKPAVDNESVVVIGDWEDYTGSAEVFNSDVYYASAANKATVRSKSEGNVVNTPDKRGFNKATHRSRQKLQYLVPDEKHRIMKNDQRNK